VLLGRDLAKIKRVADDLQVRSPQSIIVAKTLDFSDATQIQACINDVCTSEVPDIVLIAHGALSNQETCQKDLILNQKLLEINAISPVLFAEAFAGYMQKENKGKLAIIGSVAGDRGRKSNYIYGAAKGLVMRYAEGLQHRFANTNVDIILVKPGPTDTPMTANLKDNRLNNMANVNDVANLIVKGIQVGKPIVYAPAKWRLIMMVIKYLPRFIFNKINI
jgi:hypothetical protein